MIFSFHYPKCNFESKIILTLLRCIYMNYAFLFILNDLMHLIQFLAFNHWKMWSIFNDESQKITFQCNQSNAFSRKVNFEIQAKTNTKQCFQWFPHKTTLNQSAKQTSPSKYRTNKIDRFFPWPIHCGGTKLHLGPRNRQHIRKWALFFIWITSHHFSFQLFLTKTCWAFSLDFDQLVIRLWNTSML